MTAAVGRQLRDERLVTAQGCGLSPRAQLRISCEVCMNCVSTPGIYGAGER